MRLMIILINEKKKGRGADRHSGDREADAKQESRVGSLGVWMTLREVAKPIQSRWDEVRYAYNQYILIYRENREIWNQARQQ